MLSRTSLSIASSSRLAGWAAAATSSSARGTVATLSTPAPLLRHLSSTSLVASGRGGDRPPHSNRNNDRSDYRPRRQDDAFSSSNAGNTVTQYSRNQRFAPDGSRKRLPHPNAKSRSNQNQNQNRNDQRSPRPKDWTPRNSNEGHSHRRNDESSLKFGASSSGRAGSSLDAAAAKRDSTFSRLRARNAPADQDGKQGGSRDRDTNQFVDAGGVEDDAAGPTRAGDEGISEGRIAIDKSDRHHAAKQKKKEGRGSLLEVESDHGRGSYRGSSQSNGSYHRNSRQPSHSSASEAGFDILSSDQDRKPASTFKPKLLPKVTRNVFLPSVISVVMLATRMEKKLRIVQNVMTELGMEDTRPDLMLKFEDAEMIAAELNIVAIPNDEASFDIFPRPPPSTPEEAAAFPLRPPVVTIMGHVDHGKTTLLDKLRSTSVAEGEAGGITQHIGAFSVPIAGRQQDKGKQKGYRGIQTITFLDTPGHAAFTAMRSRGAMVTDIVVLVVAADDGVMPQTREVIELVAKANPDIDSSDEMFSQPPVQMIVALNKVDKPDADPERVKRELLAAGVELEELGGDIPCVHVSGKTGRGLEDLEETIATLAELADLRAEKVGLPEGYVIESKVDKGRGNVATVLVKRSVLESASCIGAGTAWCRVRQSMHAGGRPVARALPDVLVAETATRVLSSGGDLFIASRP